MKTSQKGYEKMNDVVLTGQGEVYDILASKESSNPITEAYRGIINLGVSTAEHTYQQKYIRLTNFISLVVLLGGTLYFTLSILWENWQWTLLLLGYPLVTIVTLVFNHLGKTDFSRAFFLIFSNVVLMLNSLYVGDAANIDYFMILSVITPFLIYDIREAPMIGLGVLLPLSFLFSYEFAVILFEDFHLLPQQQMILERLNIPMIVAMVVLSLYQLVRLTKNAEEELETSNAQLLMQAAELKRSNSDLEQFAYIISHDLKTPVRNISSFMNLLSNKYSNALPPEAQEFVQYSHTGSKRLERLIDDVLAYCRIGTNLPRPVPVNVGDVVNTIRFEMREKLSARNASIQINRELPVVNHVHASLMYHIFQNLISNGLKFNESERPLITINWTNSLNYHTFSVHDNGIGISKEYSTTIFQMFKRLHAENEYEGTGIGLSICKKIVDYYNGEIWFDSSPEKGTTFYFTIRKF